jgi:hypothetical protein
MAVAAGAVAVAVVVVVVVVGVREGNNSLIHQTVSKVPVGFCNFANALRIRYF